MQDCSGDGDCASASWIGDGYCDGVEQEWGIDFSCYDNDGGDCDEVLPDFEIELSLIYPQSEEHIENYNSVDIQWSYEGSFTDSVYISVYFSYQYGGGLKTIAENIYIDDEYVNVDLSRTANGTSLCQDDDPDCVESIFGVIKIIGTHTSGESEETEARDIIVGNPEGDLGINWLDSQESILSVDWGWLYDQNIIIQEQAFSTISNFDLLNIFDANGIFDTNCEHPDSTSNIQLLSIQLNNNMDSRSYTLPCGVDYCSEGGERIVGYNYGNPIIFYAFSEELGYNIELFPIIANNESSYYNNTSVTIEDFSFGQVNSDNNHYYEVSIDDRDYDGFAIYNKVTSIQLRDCEPVEGCTDPLAVNYDDEANQLDCSCYYDNGGSGCMDPAAFNFNPSATSDDGSCITGSCIVGCMDNSACNYDATSVLDDGCLYGNDCMMGCTDSSACNYGGSLADGWIDDGSCVYTVNDAANQNNGWCPLDTLYSVTVNTYNDRIPSMQSNSNLKYRVWLLDSMENEVLKTFESNGVNVTVCEEVDCNGEFGGSAYIDECGECITEENLCDDCEIADSIGDINGDGEINVIDIVVLASMILTEAVLTPEETCIADINGDGSINVIDIVWLANIILG